MSNSKGLWPQSFWFQNLQGKYLQGVPTSLGQGLLSKLTYLTK